ncbi:LysR family transcriptional regulator [Roseateles aquatilis]|uniref:LysR family transcriptional regulator n=1 Tax=Roseateles aquatilis TaxID=431061 RepID=A0A246J7U9_9BURK|nr:LysR family transcriptional regulator [Roseateles aquatilis]
MNLSWIDDFMVLASTGHFSRAAEERHMTQPAFSRRIRALEEWLGVELFDRSSQPARLTEAGLWFRKAAQDLQAHVARVPGEARAIAEASSQTLRFAATHALSFTFMPRWLRALEVHTNVGPVNLVSDVQQKCEALLQQHQVQFMLSHGHRQVQGPLDEAAFPSVVVGADQLLPVCAPRADGAPSHPLVSAQGTAVQLLAYSAESGLGRLLRELRGAALERLGVQPVFTAHLASVLRTMALDGRGVAWLPRMLVGDDLASGRLVVAGEPDWHLDLEIRLHRDRNALGAAGEAFWAAASAAAGAVGKA